MRHVVTWLALLLLLALTVGLAELGLGALGLACALSIAAAKTGLIAASFMHLDRSSPTVRLAAGASGLWLLLLFGLTFADYLTRGAH